MKAVAIPDVTRSMLRVVLPEDIEPSSAASTDELYTYHLLTGDGFRHGPVSHGRSKPPWTFLRHSNRRQGIIS